MTRLSAASTLVLNCSSRALTFSASSMFSVANRVTTNVFSLISLVKIFLLFCSSAIVLSRETRVAWRSAMALSDTDWRIALADMASCSFCFKASSSLVFAANCSFSASYLWASSAACLVRAAMEVSFSRRCWDRFTMVSCASSMACWSSNTLDRRAAASAARPSSSVWCTSSCVASFTFRDSTKATCSSSSACSSSARSCVSATSLSSFKHSALSTSRTTSASTSWRFSSATSASARCKLKRAVSFFCTSAVNCSSRSASSALRSTSCCTASDKRSLAMFSSSNRSWAATVSAWFTAIKSPTFSFKARSSS
mmetsp:Transcript_47831/g.83757  ORF Transcript_47831/g.83757 Transcript_47831/m.83757 type:complete len:311 (+) Transcript_47831:1139-2071(+)